MDAHTEQAYQQRIVKLELQNTSLEACVSDLTRQLAERNEQLTQRDATIAALQQQVTELSKQVADLPAQSPLRERLQIRNPRRQSLPDQSASLNFRR